MKIADLKDWHTTEELVERLSYQDQSAPVTIMVGDVEYPLVEVGCASRYTIDFVANTETCERFVTVLYTGDPISPAPQTKEGGQE